MYSCCLLSLLYLDLERGRAIAVIVILKMGIKSIHVIKMLYSDLDKGAQSILPYSEKFQFQVCVDLVMHFLILLMAFTHGRYPGKPLKTQL